MDKSYIVQLLKHDIIHSITRSINSILPEVLHDWMIINTLILCLVTFGVVKFCDSITEYIYTAGEWIVSVFSSRQVYLDIDNDSVISNGETFTMGNNNNKRMIRAIIAYIRHHGCCTDSHSNRFNFEMPFNTHNTRVIFSEGLRCFRPMRRALIRPHLWLEIINSHDTRDNQVRITDKLRIYTDKNIEYIMEFLREVSEYYLTVLPDESKHRYYYNYTDRGWKRYQLHKKRTFNSVFFPEKEELLRILHDFKNNTGIYQLEAVTRGIGLLLYGPPGTGKTSIIKILSHVLQRDVVNINLRCVRSNGELFDIFYNDWLDQVASNSGYHKGDNKKEKAEEYHVPIDRRIYVFEDVDCLGEIVQRRGQSTGNMGSDTTKTGNSLQQQQSPALSSDSAHVQESSNLVQYAMVQQNMTDKKKDKKDSLLDLFNKMYSNDILSLDGLLNILQGPIDNENMIWILTTNHVDKLDPALIRPGRITQRINLGYVQPEYADQMFRYYYKNQIPANLVFDWQFVLGKQLTPATFETIFISHPNYNDAYQHIRDMTANNHDDIPTTQIANDTFAQLTT